MERQQALAHVLRLLLDGEPADAIEACRAEHEAHADPYVQGLWSFAAFWATDFAGASVTAERTLAAASDPEARLLGLAVAGLAAAGRPVPSEDGTLQPDPLQTALDDVPLLDLAPPDSRTFILYLLAEGSLACARLPLAEAFAERAGDLPATFLDDDGGPHPFLAVLYVMRVRLLAFRARITEAQALGERARALAAHPTTALLLDATMCLVQGNAGRRSSVHRLADRLQRTLPAPRDYVSSGCYLLVAFGLVAVSDVARSAELTIAAGGGAGLARLTIIDRALGLELLVAAAVVAEDLDAAEAWRDQAEVLAGHPIAAPTVERIASRVALLAGDAATAVTWAEQAVQHAAEAGRSIELAEGEIVLGRARIALAQRGLASTALESMVDQALGSGHVAAQKAAARELRGIGRRLRPPRGSGWDGLSARERDIALLVVEGFSNQAIAREMQLSPHTVRAHVSRVLAAFGVASRSAVVTRLAGILPADVDVPPALTPRQLSVVEQMTRGRTNEQIGQELGVSVKTVEKHVGEIFRRWDVVSRTGVVRRALALAPSATPEVAAPSSK